MRIEISEQNYKALCELAKRIPVELAARSKKTKRGNEYVDLETRRGAVATVDAELGGELIVSMVQAAKLMREISYHAQIVRLQEERAGETSPPET